MAAASSELVVAVVLSWNRSHEVIRCVQSIRQSDYSHLEVVVVDNASTDTSVQQIQRALPDVELICNSANLGFTGGVNVGIRKAIELGASYVWLVNDDAIVAPDCLRRLVSALLSDESIGIASPAVHFRAAPNNVDCLACRIDADNLRIACTSAEPEVKAWSEAKAPLVVWGTGMLIRRATIDTVGLLDDRYFAYFEDADYCMRALSRGWRSVCVSSAKIFHDRATGWADRPPHFHYLMSRNEWQFWSTHGKATRLRKLKRYLTSRLAVLSALKAAGAEANVQAVLAGMYDAWNGNFGPPRVPYRSSRWLYFLLATYPWPVLSLLDRSGFRSGRI